VSSSARDRRLARRLSRKVAKAGAPSDIYVAFLAGLQRGLEMRETQVALPPAIHFGDRFFGTTLAAKQAPSLETDDADLADFALERPIVLH